VPNSLRICALLLLAPTGLAQDLPAARVFVQHLYSSYAHPPSQADPDTTGKLAPSTFSPSLLQLIRRDRARTPRGDASALDGDPICDCQDFEGLRLTTLTVTAVDATHASASVTFQVFADDPKSVRSLRLNLLYTPQGWRIDDIASADTPSLRKFLQQSH
jgi:hypothetical protein